MPASFCSLAGLTALVSLSFLAAPRAEARESIALTTGYLDRWVALPDVPRVARFGLRLTLDARGGGGTLELDPNIARYDRFGDLVQPAGTTEIAPRRVKVTLRAAAPDRQGHRLYHIEGAGLQGRLALVLTPDGPHRLLVLTPGGEVREVLPLREERSTSGQNP